MEVKTNKNVSIMGGWRVVVIVILIGHCQLVQAADWGSCSCPKTSMGEDPCLKCTNKAKCQQEKCVVLTKLISDPTQTVATEMACKYTPPPEKCGACPHKPHKVIIQDCPDEAPDIGGADESCKVFKCVYAPLNWSGRFNDPAVSTVDCKGQ